MTSLLQPESGSDATSRIRKNESAHMIAFTESMN